MNELMNYAKPISSLPVTAWYKAINKYHQYNHFMEVQLNSIAYTKLCTFLTVTGKKKNMTLNATAY